MVRARSLESLHLVWGDPHEVFFALCNPALPLGC